jgi:hypothetical protein
MKNLRMVFVGSGNLLFGARCEVMGIGVRN